MNKIHKPIPNDPMSFKHNVPHRINHLESQVRYLNDKLNTLLEMMSSDKETQDKLFKGFQERWPNKQ